MRNTREILRQKWLLKRTHRDIVASVGVSMGAITLALTYAFWDTVIDRGPRAVLVNFERLNPLFNQPRLRRAVVSEVEKRRSAFERNLVAEARVIAHPVMRGVVNAFDWVIGNSFSRPLMNCASLVEAERFLRSKLVERGVLVVRPSVA